MKVSHQFIGLQMGGAEIPGSAETVSKAPKETLESIRDRAIEAGRALGENHRETTLKMSLQSINPEKFQKSPEKKFTHENEILINKIKDNDKETIKKLFQIRLTLKSSLQNLSADLDSIILQIQKVDPRVMPTEGKKNFTNQMDELFSTSDPAKFAAKAVPLCEEIKSYYDQLLIKARSIDISI